MTRKRDNLEGLDPPKSHKKIIASMASKLEMA